MNATRPTINQLRLWIEVRHSRSPGPGGQNVNKVNTRVSLLFDLDACTVLTGFEKSRIRRLLSTRMARDGRLRVSSRRERTQSRNKAAAEVRLIELIAEALHVPKTRRPTRPTAGSRRRRLADKRRRSLAKQHRRSTPTADD